MRNDGTCCAAVQRGFLQHGFSLMYFGLILYDVGNFGECRITEVIMCLTVAAETGAGP